MVQRNIDVLVREYCEAPIPDFIRRDEIIRDLPKPARFNLVEIIVGMRRSGKTFYIFQLIDRLVQSGVSREHILYFNFSDDRLEPLESDVMDQVLDSFWRQHPSAREEGVYLFLDEVQEVDNWQGFCQRVAETENVTLVITGSSSKLSSDEIASKFRGRSHEHEMLPLSFREFCRFRGLDDELLNQDALSSRERVSLESLFDAYLLEGGFPGVQGRSPEDRIELLQSYVRDVVARDVAERFGREDIRLANQFALFGLRNTACELSINNLVDDLREQGFKIYWERANALVTLIEQAFLFFEVQEYSTSLRAKSTSVPKVYAIDPGIVYAVSRANQQDVGKRLETVVYVELRRRMAGKRMESITSYVVPKKSSHKVDFLLGDAMDDAPYELIQVCADMSGEKTRKRELGSIEEAMRATGLERGTIVTLAESEVIGSAYGEISVVPAWEWMTKDARP